MMAQWSLERHNKRNVNFNGELITRKDTEIWDDRWYSFALYRTQKRGTYILESVHKSNHPGERTFADVWIENEREPEKKSISELDGFCLIPESFKQEALAAGFTEFNQFVE